MLKSPPASDPVAAVERFNEAFNRHDGDAIMAAMTEDCVFENTRPVPDGERIEGPVRVRAFWEEFFRRSPGRTSKQRRSLAPWPRSSRM